jgi:hypothetical protein
MKALTLLAVLPVAAMAQSDLKTFQITCTRDGAELAVATYFEIRGELAPQAAVRQSPSTQVSEAFIVRQEGETHLLYESEGSAYRKAIVLKNGRAEYRELPNGQPVAISCTAPKEIGSSDASASRQNSA